MKVLNTIVVLCFGGAYAMDYSFIALKTNVPEIKTNLLVFINDKKHIVNVQNNSESLETFLQQVDVLYTEYEEFINQKCAGKLAIKISLQNIAKLEYGILCNSLEKIVKKSFLKDFYTIHFANFS